jgi:chromosome segregation ATPase
MTADNSTDRLDDIQQELAAILESRLGELSRILHRNEVTTRRIVATEMEIKRHESDAIRMESELDQLRDNAAEIAGRRIQLESQHADGLRDRSDQKASLEALEIEVRDADSENSSAARRLAQLEEEAGALRQDNADLKTKLRTIEENIARMRSLREEIMSSISEGTSQLKRLSGTGLD